MTAQEARDYSLKCTNFEPLEVLNQIREACEAGRFGIQLDGEEPFAREKSAFLAQLGYRVRSVAGTFYISWTGIE